MTRQHEGTDGPMRVRLVPLLIRLAALIAVSVVVASLLWRGKGWQEDFASQEKWLLPSPVEAPAGPSVVRQPVVAGKFYSAEPDELYGEVEDRLGALDTVGLRGVRAILVPHAGYVFSADVAAAAFREVDRNFRRVFILASNHSGQNDFSGVSLPDVTHYAIPGVEIPVSPVVNELRAEPLFTHEEMAHSMHMVEVELPFLHVLRGRPEPVDYSVVPMIVGRLGEDGVTRLADTLDRYADEETIFVFSVDLSHFYPDTQARRLDNYTIEAIMAQDQEALAGATTDGNHVLATMLALVGRQGWEPTFLMARNSGDVSGDRSRVVGYAAIAFHEPLALNKEEQQELLAWARSSIEGHLARGRAPKAGKDLLERLPVFNIPRAVFVTLEKDGRLRGCIGDLTSTEPLHAGVRKNAIAAAVRDARFPAVTAEELVELTVKISVLGFPTRVTVEQPEQYLDALRPMKDGVILVHEGRRSTFLPEVWEDLPDPEQFLTRLSLKQGSPPDAWRAPETVLYRYGTYTFGEKSS